MGRIWSFVWRGGVALLALWLVNLKGAQQVRWIGPDPVLEFLLVIGACGGFCGGMLDEPPGPAGFFES